jgi:hypothetical protein
MNPGDLWKTAMADSRILDAGCRRSGMFGHREYRLYGMLPKE